MIWEKVRLSNLNCPRFLWLLLYSAMQGLATRYMSYSEQSVTNHERIVYTNERYWSTVCQQTPLNSASSTSMSEEYSGSSMQKVPRNFFKEGHSNSIQEERRSITRDSLMQRVKHTAWEYSDVMTTSTQAHFDLTISTVTVSHFE